MHRILDSEIQLVDSEAVDASCRLTDLSRLTAVNVTSVGMECTGLFAGKSVLKCTPPNEWASVRLLDNFPDVTRVRSVPRDPCTPRQRSEVPLTQSVASQLVCPILRFADRCLWAKDAPVTVRLVDPVLAVLPVGSRITVGL